MKEKNEEDTFDINTIGLYDAEKDRKWKERSKIAYAEKKGQTSIITAMLNNGMSQEEISRMSGIKLAEIKKMGLS